MPALWDGLGKTVVFITHDVDEAILMSDRVVVMTGRPRRIRTVSRSLSRTPVH